MGLGLVMAAAGLLAGYASQATTSSVQVPSGTKRTSAAPRTQGRGQAAAVISDRSGPSWSGRLRDTVQVDWFDQTTGQTHGELIAVLAVRRLPDPGGEKAPNEFGDDVGPHECGYAIKVCLTGLDESTARSPAAHSSLS